MSSLFIKRASIDWSKISAGSYLRDITALKNLYSLEFKKPVTFFVGENGSGKSTMLEAIAVADGFNPEGGTKNYSFSTHDSHSELHEAITLVKGSHRPEWGYFLRAESFYNVATKEMDYSLSRYTSERLHEKSHGESFMAVVQNHFVADGLYLLDEPEAALSPQRQLALLIEIYERAMQGSQFIIVTHSPILLGFPDADIFSFDGDCVHLCKYEETDSFQVTEMFLNNREQMLNRLGCYQCL